MQSRHLFFKLLGRFKKPNKSVRDPSSGFKTTAAEKKKMFIVILASSLFKKIYLLLLPRLRKRFSLQ